MRKLFRTGLLSLCALALMSSLALAQEAPSAGAGAPKAPAGQTTTKKKKRAAKRRAAKRRAAKKGAAAPVPAPTPVPAPKE